MVALYIVFTGVILILSYKVIICLMKFTGLYMPLIAYIGLYIVFKISGVDIIHDKGLDGITIIVMVISLVLSLLIFIRNIIRIFKDDFSILGFITKRNYRG
ncbi:hypothetical protein FDC26_17720 [Clostridium botulinum]|uniref:hypothetical protein n=1 Tax=unclassified Clostridium TaxID=2614128 RepID=UPI0013C7DD9B|nr:MULTISPECIES: hypothetical protein [unclassified Clostridium]NFN78676.1 hypothetical protein [Clostridium botulinum]NFO79216.1 hypothetical protein [Clostridium botulinum]NFP05980.1 hypothetical protein [Clostridium botulinum]NFS02267.1 hypothetical protein [Clostridium botulinum]NFT97355.1 hypothetical protein [Clostridium botulinum]